MRCDELWYITRLMRATEAITTENSLSACKLLHLLPESGDPERGCRPASKLVLVRTLPHPNWLSSTVVSYAAEPRHGEEKVAGAW